MMIRNTLIVLFALFFFACNNAGKATDKITDSLTIENYDGHAGDHHEEHTSGLSLNNGAKWQADESTRIHAAKLNAEIRMFNKIENADVTAYQTFAADIQKELNSLVSGCKMKGADHDALHLWLEPVLKDVTDLKKASTADEGEQTVQRLTENVQKFNQYFN